MNSTFHHLLFSVLNYFWYYTKLYFKKQGSSQWQSGYPNSETIYNDFLKKQGYVLVNNNEIIGYAALVLEDDPNYKVIDGAWLSNKEYGVMHRCCIRNSCKGNGYIHDFFEELEKLCKKTNKASMRIDTHELNKSMIRAIQKENYTYTGIVIVGDGTKRNAYEKLICE